MELGKILMDSEDFLMLLVLLLRHFCSISFLLFLYELLNL